MTTPYQINKFDIKNIKKSAICLIFGKARTGKTSLVKDIISNLNIIEGGIVSCVEEDYHEFNSQSGVVIDMKYQHIVPELLKKQRNSANKLKDNFLVIDNGLYDNAWAYDTCIKEVFTNNKQLSISIILANSAPLSLPNNLSKYIDYIFVFKETSVCYLKIIYEKYCPVLFPSFEFFVKLVDDYTKDYNCLIINNDWRISKIEDCVFYYKSNQILVEKNKSTAIPLESNAPILNVEIDNFIVID